MNLSADDFQNDVRSPRLFPEDLKDTEAIQVVNMVFDDHVEYPLGDIEARGLRLRLGLFLRFLDVPFDKGLPFLFDFRFEFPVFLQNQLFFRIFLSNDFLGLLFRFQGGAHFEQFCRRFV